MQYNAMSVALANTVVNMHGEEQDAHVFFWFVSPLYVFMESQGGAGAPAS